MKGRLTAPARPKAQLRRILFVTRTEANGLAIDRDAGRSDAVVVEVKASFRVTFGSIASNQARVCP
jgi:hypothetical protein